jgi:hypothetical protein
MAGTRESARFGRRAGDWDENHTIQNNVGDLRGPEIVPEPEPVIRGPIIEAPVIGDPIIEDAAVNAAIDTAVNDDEPSSRQKKGGISAGMNHEIDRLDDSLPIDAKGIAA